MNPFNVGDNVVLTRDADIFGKFGTVYELISDTRVRVKTEGTSWIIYKCYIECLMSMCEYSYKEDFLERINERMT